MRFLVLALSLSLSSAFAAPDDVLRTQIWLDQAHFSVGEIDGVNGSSTKSALKAFQTRHGLTVTGKLDEGTQRVLDNGQPLFKEHVLTAEDVAGPFAPTPPTMVDKSKLKSLPYTSVVEKLAEKFEVSQALLRNMNARSEFKEGETLNVPVVGGPIQGTITRIIVDKSEETLKAYDSEGVLLAYYPTTLGRKGTPPYGEWTVKSTTKNPWYLYDPKHGAPGGPTMANIPPGPNNPVGVVWMALSAPHYGIHGVPSPEKIGKNESEGCIRLTNWDALEVAAAITKNAKVLVQR